VPAGELRIAVRLTPRGGADRVDGVVDGALRVRVAAAPADGAANEALLRLLGRELDIPRSGIRLVAGHAARAKVVTVAATADLRRRLLERWPGLAV